MSSRQTFDNKLIVDNCRIKLLLVLAAFPRSCKFQESYDAIIQSMTDDLPVLHKFLLEEEQTLVDQHVLQASHLEQSTLILQTMKVVLSKKSTVDKKLKSKILKETLENEKIKKELALTVQSLHSTRARNRDFINRTTRRLRVLASYSGLF